MFLRTGVRRMKADKIFAILLFISSLLPAHAEDKKKEEIQISDEELLEILNYLDLLENLDLLEEMEFLENFEILYFQEVSE